MENISTTFEHVMTRLPMFALAFGLLVLGVFVARKGFEFIVKRNLEVKSWVGFKDELTEKDNGAFGIAYAGFFVGLAIAISGALFGIGEDPKTDLINLLMCGPAAIVLMILSSVVTEKVILRKFTASEEIIDDKNDGAGFVVAGAYIATGLMINGVMTGESDSTLLMFRDICVYWAIGQFILVIGSFVFEVITKYKVHEVIEHHDNAAAGASMGGFLLALGIIVRKALVGATSNLGDEAITTAVIAGVGILVLCGARAFADKFLLPGKKTLSEEVGEDKNHAAGYIAAASFIGIAVLFTAIIG